MSELFAAIVLLIGSLFTFIAALGVQNMPDVLCRAHALSKALTLGISLMLLALLIDLGTQVSSTKIALAILFQIVTIPISGHIFALYAYTDK